MRNCLLLSIIISLNCVSCMVSMKRSCPVDCHDLRKEIFIKQFYRDYSFGLLIQISSKNPVRQNAFAALIAQGHQKYIAFATNWDPQTNGTLKPFSDCSLCDLEDGSTISLTVQE